MGYILQYQVMVFENRVLRRIFGPKRDEVMGEWRKLHNEELCDLYSSNKQNKQTPWSESASKLH
jgi:hypothetical protein